jgi:DNA-binding ferritin-like protein
MENFNKIANKFPHIYGVKNTPKRWYNKNYLLSNTDSYKYQVYEAIDELYEQTLKQTEKAKDIKKNPYHLNILRKKDRIIDDLKEHTKSVVFQKNKIISDLQKDNKSIIEDKDKIIADLQNEITCLLRL